MSRYGELTPVAVASPLNNPMIHIDTAPIKPFPEDQLRFLGQLGWGDEIDIDIQPSTLHERSNHYVLHPFTTITKSETGMEYPRCPTCGSTLCLQQGLWCPNLICNNRLIGRILYLGSAEGLSIEWLAHRSLVMELVMVRHVRSITQLIDPIEWTAVEGLPDNIHYDIASRLVLFRHHLRQGLTGFFPQYMDILFNVLSYPGMDQKQRISWFSHVAKMPNPLQVIKAAFENEVVFRDTCPGMQNSPLVSYIFSQLHVFAREFGRIVDVITQEE